ncbi:MAG: hypothetical protein U0236_03140 [Nitrospira sp.]
MSSEIDNIQRIYRVDKFKVPTEARGEFLERVQMTHAILRTLPGFVEDLVLEQTSGPGVFNFVTVAIWASTADVEHAKGVMTAKHAESGVNAKELVSRLRIEADQANYMEVAG